MIPELNRFGVLPPGRHSCTLEEIEERYVHNNHRQRLWDGLIRYFTWIQSLDFYSTMLIGGSFVTNDQRPNDIDVALSWTSKPKPGVNQLEIASAVMPQITKPRFGVQAWMATNIDFSLIFTQMTGDEATRRGAPRSIEKGLLKVDL